jgi:hypothetical protein
MKRLSVILVLLFSSLCGHAATWYATSSTVNINAVGLWVPTQGASCAGSGTALIWGAQATGDVFNANGCTALAINVDPGSVSAQVTLTTDTTFGGGFTLTMANLGTIGTIHAHVTATKTVAVALSGTTSSGTISGNITGGNASTAYGINMTSTTGTLTVIGTVTGGTFATGNGINAAGGASAIILVTGNASVGSGATGGNGLSLSTTMVGTITGNCNGSDSSPQNGCFASSTGSLTVIGNIINGKRGWGANGTILFTPAATNYILTPKDTSSTLGTIDTHAIETPTNPGVTNVRLSTVYGSFTGTMTSSSSTCASVQGWR